MFTEEINQKIGHFLIDFYTANLGLFGRGFINLLYNIHIPNLQGIQEPLDSPKLL